MGMPRPVFLFLGTKAAFPSERRPPERVLKRHYKNPRRNKD